MLPFPSGTRGCRALIFIKDFGVFQGWLCGLKSPVDRFPQKGTPCSSTRGSPLGHQGGKERHTSGLSAQQYKTCIVGHEPDGLEGRWSSLALRRLQPCPPRHRHHQQLVAGGPLRVACRRAAPVPAAGTFITCHVNISKESIQPALAKPKSQGWSQEAAEAFGYQRAEAKRLA